MKKLMFALAIASVTVIGTDLIAQEIESGLRVGESAGVFNVTDCTGPAQGKAPLCYR